MVGIEANSMSLCDFSKIKAVINANKYSTFTLSFAEPSKGDPRHTINLPPPESSPLPDTQVNY